jgi:hypothetical protein
MKNQQTVEFRDHGVVYLKGIKKPAFLYDKDTHVRLKFGELEHVEQSYNTMKKAYDDSGFVEMGNALAIVQVPLNQKLIDDIFESSGRFEIFVKTLDTNILN